MFDAEKAAEQTPEIRFRKHVDGFLQEVPPLLSGLSSYSHADFFYESVARNQAVWRQHIRRLGLTRPTTSFTSDLEDGVAGYAFTGSHFDFSSAELQSLTSLPAVFESFARSRADGIGPASISVPAYPTGPPDAPDLISKEEIMALLQDASEAAFSVDDRVRAVRITYQDRVRRVLVIDAEHKVSVDATSMLALRVEVEIQHEAGRRTGYGVGGGVGGFGHFLMHPPEYLAAHTVRNVLIDFQPLPFDGPLPVVFAPGWAALWLHEAVGHVLEADYIYNRRSPFADRLNRQVAPDWVTIVDDATVAGGRASARCDDEGVASRPTVLVENGILKSFLTDHRYAALLDHRCTGNGRRATYQTPPLPRMTNLILQPGSASSDDLIKAAGNGLYVEAIRHGQILPESGRFRLDVSRARWIENGRLGPALSNLTLSGSARDVLQGIQGIGNDFALEAAWGQCNKIGQVVPISVGQPTVLVTGLVVEAGVRNQEPGTMYFY